MQFKNAICNSLRIPESSFERTTDSKISGLSIQNTTARFGKAGTKLNRMDRARRKKNYSTDYSSFKMLPLHTPMDVQQLDALKRHNYGLLHGSLE